MSSTGPPFYLSPRPRDGHKGSFGHVFLIGGSRGMAGSISLAAIAAMKSGSGLVTALVPDRCLETVGGFDPCLMTVPLADDAGGHFASTAIDDCQSRLEAASAIGIGPGMGVGDGAMRLVDKLRQLDSIPRVLDADALNLIAKHAWQASLRGPVILTPHPGEWQRLCGISPKDRPAQIKAAVQFALAYQVIVVLKGAPSVVTNGQSIYENTTGNPGMAKGGSGDCLTGIVTSLLGQGLSVFDAAKLAVYAHGLAGDLAADELGESGLLPTDLLRHLPAAMQRVSRL